MKRPRKVRLRVALTRAQAEVLRGMLGQLAMENGDSRERAAVVDAVASALWQAMERGR